MAAREKKSPLTNLVAGGTAGFMEALICHPLDTIKVRMQLAKNAPRNAAGGNLSFLGVGMRIVQKESPLALYKGLGAVTAGIVPKMAIRFTTFQFYKDLMVDKNGTPWKLNNLWAGLFAGITEAVLVVTPMDVVKIRLQAQRHSMTDPLDVPKYRNAAHCVFTVVREEGVGALYRGVALTSLRQATNQAANFPTYHFLKGQLLKIQDVKELPGYQAAVIGCISGAMGPLVNNPIDIVKTRIQKTPNPEGLSGWARFTDVNSQILKNEGWRAFYKGVTPRVLRVAPGQAVTFAVYERVSSWLDRNSDTFKLTAAAK
ncbi:mitochondrial carrier domain-containing protein [Lobosporangium transversale]|uniref:Mitochondrial carrier domain-containing protein n=1 Tax=Lobosporangium transversale TaxID=64571 RepID=A0A1Y2GT12_9FUNG|nr:mitochondrial carrier domain-containing protein [Lobosporangium transversale]ORZ19242.1 mitochondrial carrier domain-containing protein [Lobosporangium transversale]|eukprot:XP_021882410.1 mitochondrial carrier domain-containing protein [Lobosporangium transversale]